MAEADDIRMLGSVMAEVHKQNTINRLAHKLDIAEAVNAAIIGSTRDEHGRNSSAYARWLSHVETEIAKLQGQTIRTIWDAPRKSRRLGR